jgi:photosystem II stability/assembly factor-like uncharacterized protein
MSKFPSFAYIGLAGDTGPGKPISTGLYRSEGGQAPWERIDAGIQPAPQVRAIAVDPRRPGRVLIGTQSGIYRSEDCGAHWLRLPAPNPDLAVWSLLHHPRDPDTILAGYEPCAIHRTTDDGLSWTPLPISVTFPAISLAEPLPKRVTGIAVDPSRPDEIYASIEVGGLLRSLDAGRSWSCATDGLYRTDAAVDLHATIVSSAHPKAVCAIGRIGMFVSDDRGDHWRNAPVPALTEDGTYSRALVVAPDDPDLLYLGGGTAFEGDRGALFRSSDFGATWKRLDLGAEPRSTIFSIGVDARNPANIVCATKGGEVFYSGDRGSSWKSNPLPDGATRAYAVAFG